MAKLRPPVKTHGGKYYLAPFIIDNFPNNYEDLNYGEVFVGGGSVLLQKKKSHLEQICDTDWGIMCIWRSLKKEPEEFIARLKSLTYSAETFEKSRLFMEDPPDTDPIKWGLHEYVVRRMSRGGMRKAFAWSERLRGGKPGDLNAWETALELLPAIAERVKDVVPRCYDFRVSMKVMNDPSYVLYLDPPYMKATRAKGATEVYKNEMTDEDHNGMLDLCLSSKAKIIVSGYESSLYNDKLSSWNKVFKNVPNHSGQNSHKVTKREVLWKNF